MWRISLDFVRQNQKSIDPHFARKGEHWLKWLYYLLQVLEEDEEEAKVTNLKKNQSSPKSRMFHDFYILKL